MMSTQNQAEHGVIHSSIALLQERFRQLQRVKEMREQKQLLRLFSADNYKIHIPSDSSCHFHDHLSSASPITASTTTTTATATANSNNDVDDVVMVDDDELHIFLPPNYYHTNYSRCSSSNNMYNTNNKPNSSSLSRISINNNNNNQDSPNNINNNLTEISLSLWPPAISYNNANANANANGGGGSMEAPLSTLSERLPSSCVSTASKFEDSPLVSDVDTTLHL